MQPRRESIKFALWQGSNRSVITTGSVWLPVIILQLLDIGAEWSYSLEEFLAYDFVNIYSDKADRLSLHSENQLFMPTHPPVVRTVDTIYNHNK